MDNDFKKYSIKNFFNKYKTRYIFGIIWLIFVDMLQLIIPWLLGDFTDRLKLKTIDIKGIIIYALIIVGLAIFIAFFRYLWRLYIVGTSRLLEKQIREDFYSHLLKLSTNYFNDQKTGDLMAHATNDIKAVRQAMGPGVAMFFDSAFLVIATILILIFQIDIRLTMIALIPLPFLALLSTYFSKAIHEKFTAVQEAFSNLTDKVQENFSGIRVIKAFTQEDMEIEKFATANKLNYEKNIDLVKTWGLFHPMVQFITSLSFLIVIWYGGKLVIDGIISLGDFVAFNSYLGLLTWPMMAVGFVINLLQRGTASLKRLNKIFNEKEEVHDQDIIPLDDLKGNIEFNNLSFRYNEDDQYVLDEISLKIKAGQTVAFLGRTGSGKTTIINLLLRLFNVDKNQILIDGYDINKIPIKLLRKKIGIVPQDNFLFSSSIANNIAFFDPNETNKEQIINAAKITKVYNDIAEFPEKFDTILGERGVTLSGGQKQRISMARAIIKNPKILILDDSFSAVDTHTEEKILNNLKPIMEDKTVILISHRISTIKNADMIYVLDQGKIIERGTHNKLIKNDKLYNDIYQKQQLEEKIANIN
ncbi:MAG: ABC transporter ATP-binding protein/permease [Halanaerobiales bacterium]|nr:ABC transporter ATP-binding protein/permease [Halanaerobiales bacterium]